MDETTQPIRTRRQWEAVAKIRLSKGECGSEVETDFVKQGLDPQSAKAILDQAFRNVRSRAKALLIASSAFSGLGLIVTVASYYAAASSLSGGTYFIWYGAVIAGGTAALIAVARLIQVRR